MTFKVDFSHINTALQYEKVNVHVVVFDANG